MLEATMLDQELVEDKDCRVDLELVEEGQDFLVDQEDQDIDTASPLDTFPWIRMASHGVGGSMIDTFVWDTI